MSEATPQLFVWDAGRSVMVPVRKSYADRTYVDGQDYRLGVIEERSGASHNHYFASIAEAHRNLPDDLSERFVTPDHLRKYALIKAAYCDERTHPCKSHAEALRMAAFIRPIDDYALVIVTDNIVRVFTARSQSAASMGKVEFQDSKTKVLEIVSAMIGTKPSILAANAGVAA